MFDHDFEYIPTLREIRDGLIGGQMEELEKTKDKWSEQALLNSKTIKIMYAAQWKLLFKFEHFNHALDVPLTRKILQDPHHPITQQIIYIYSMQSFIYPTLNKTCRQ